MQFKPGDKIFAVEVNVMPTRTEGALILLPCESRSTLLILLTTLWHAGTWADYYAGALLSSACITCTHS